MPTEVTDPALLAQLNAASAPTAPAPPGQEVTDPGLLAQLNAGSAPAAPASGLGPQSDYVNPASLNPTELANYNATHGAGWAGAPGSVTAPGQSAVGDVASGFASGIQNRELGIKQIAAHIGNMLGLVSDDQVKQVQGQIDAAQQANAPYLATTGGKVGNVAENVAEWALAPGGSSIAASALKGAALEGAAPVATGGPSRLQNIASGAEAGAVGAGVGKVIGGALGGLGGTADDKWDAVSTLKQAGIPLSVGQETGNKMAQQIERASAMTSGGPAAFDALQKTAVTRAVLSNIGETGGDGDAPDVIGAMRDARTRIKGVMDDATSQGLTVDAPLTAKIQDFKDNLPGSTVQSARGPILKNLSDLQAAAQANGGTVPGQVLQRIRTNLGNLSSNPQVGGAAGDLQELLDDALPPTPELTLARQQYRALKQIEPSVDPATATINYNKLYTTLNTQANRNQTLYGQGDQGLINLVKAAKQVIPDSLGNSGTAERFAVPLGAIEAATSERPLLTAARIAAAGALVNRAGAAMRNPGLLGNYLKSGVLGLIPEGEAATELPAGMQATPGTSLSIAPLLQPLGGYAGYATLANQLGLRPAPQADQP